MKPDNLPPRRLPGMGLSRDPGPYFDLLPFRRPVYLIFLSSSRYAFEPGPSVSESSLLLDLWGFRQKTLDPR